MTPPLAETWQLLQQNAFEHFVPKMDECDDYRDPDEYSEYRLDDVRVFCEKIGGIRKDSNHGHEDDVTE